jgi:hypothetical protein
MKGDLCVYLFRFTKLALEVHSTGTGYICVSQVKGTLYWRTVAPGTVSGIEIPTGIVGV